MSAPPPTDSRGWPTRPELRWAGIFALVVMLLTCLPYLYGLLIRPPGDYYSGFLTNPDDHNVYLAYMRQASEGNLFTIDPFTSEPQVGRVVNVFFLALGGFSRATRLSLPVTYHLARVVSGWLLLLAIYCFSAQVLSSVSARRLAVALAALASGLGWAVQPGAGRPHPIDYGPGLIMPEAITSLSLLLNPLFCSSMFLMVAVIGFGGYAFATGSRRSAALAGLATLVLANIHTYDLIPVAATLVAYLVFLLLTRRARIGPSLKLVALILVIASPSLAYQAWLLQAGDITLSIKMTQALVYSPPPLMFALGLGLGLLLALAALPRAIGRDAPPAARLLVIWLALGFGLAYIPVPFQRKLFQGAQIPMMLLAAFGIEPLLRRLPGPRAALAGSLLLAFMLPSNLLFVGRAMQDLQTNNAAYIANLMPPLYLRADQRAALAWLDDHADSGDTLMCNSFLGNYAPSLAGTRVYVGHWSETLDFREKLSGYAHFLRADSDDAGREALVRREGITYVLRDRSIYDEVFHLSPEGEALPAFDLDRADWLVPAFTEGQVALYRVK